MATFLFELMHSVEPVWALWAGSLILMGIMTRFFQTRRAVIRDWKVLLTSEDGAAYTLSYVFSFPIVMLLVCVAVETSLILTVKTGTMYAAFAAARSAIVWIPAFPPGSGAARHKIQLAAVQAMVPFAEGNPMHTERLGYSLSEGGAGAAYHAAYQKYGAGRSPAPASYLAKKYSYAQQATSVRWTPEEPIENADLELTLTYRMPLHVPGAARFLGQENGVYVIESRVVLQNEGPKRESTFNELKPLGIDYQPRL